MARGPDWVAPKTGHDWQDEDILRATAWLRSFVPERDLARRLDAARDHLLAVRAQWQEGLSPPLYDPADAIAWYIFQAETPDIALERAERLMGLLGISRKDPHQLQTIPIEALLSAAATIWPGAAFNPIAGTVGQFRPVSGVGSLPTHPFDPTGPAVSADVPLIIGTTLTEDAFFLGADPAVRDLDLAALVDRVKRLLPEADAEALVREYRAANPGAELDFILYLISSDHRYLRDTTILAERKANQGRAKVWSYLFRRMSPAAGGRLYSPHGADLPFALDNLDRPEAIFVGGPPDTDSRRLCTLMSGAWAAFARSGDPNHEGLPRWPAYERIERQTMVFDDHSRAASDPRQAERIRMLSLPGHS